MTTPKGQIPKTVAILLDGNRRWAKARNLPEIEGHKVTLNNLKSIIRRAGELGVQSLTLWIFSPENFRRDQKFLDSIFALAREYLKRGEYFEEITREGGKLSIIGDLSLFPKDIEKGMLKYILNSNPKEKKIDVVLAMGYGGRNELARAFKKMLADKVPPEEVTEEKIYSYLDMKEDVDLMIRTGARQRTSGLYIYQAAYAELYFTNVMCPDFTVKEFDKALVDFAKRQRNFGR